MAKEFSQKWHTTINWMEETDIVCILNDNDYPASKRRNPDPREELRYRVMKGHISTSVLEPYIPEDKAHTWEGPSHPTNRYR